MGQVEDVFRLGGDPEVVVDVELFEEIVEAAHPHVAKHDAGGLEDGGDGVWVVHRHENSLCRERKGLARAESGAVAQKHVAGVVYKLLLGWEEGVVDLGAEVAVLTSASCGASYRRFEAFTAGDRSQDAHTYSCAGMYIG